MQVKLIQSYDDTAFLKIINEWLADNPDYIIHDMQYSMTAHEVQRGQYTKHKILYAAFILYEE